MSVRFHLCLDGSFAIVEKEGSLYYRSWDRLTDKIALGRSGAKESLLRGLMLNQDYIPVVGLDGEVEPEIPDGVHWPLLEFRQVPGKGSVYAIISLEDQCPQGGHGSA